MRALPGIALRATSPLRGKAFAAAFVATVACGDGVNHGRAPVSDAGEPPDAEMEGGSLDVDEPSVRDPGVELDVSVVADGAEHRPVSQRRYPRDTGKLGATKADWTSVDGQSFDYLETAQFSLRRPGPGETVARLRVATTKPGPFSHFIAFQENRFLGRFAWGAVLDGIRVANDHPAHLTLIPATEMGKVDAARAYGVWLTWTVAPPASETFAHVCRIKGEIPWPISDADFEKAIGRAETGCKLRKPGWRFLDRRSEGKGAFVEFLGSMVEMGTGDVLIELAAAADLHIPLTNSMVSFPVVAGREAACEEAARRLDEGGTATDACLVTYAARFARKTTGRIVIRGLGRINGKRLLDAEGASFQKIAASPGDQVKLAAVSRFAEYMVRSGLVEIGSAHPSDAASGKYSIDVSGISVGFAPKRFMGAIVLNASYQPMEAGASNDNAVRVFDLKNPGTWVGASDGPEVMGAGSRLDSLYVQSADDSIKLHGRALSIQNVTVLQGNAGGVINIGAYGFNRGTAGTRVSNVFVHRITQSGPGYDQLGGVITSRNCAAANVGQDVRDVRITNLYVPSLGGQPQQGGTGTRGPNSIHRLVALGFNRDGLFCGRTQPANITMSNITFAGFAVYVDPIAPSLLYNDPGEGTNLATTTFEDVRFFDTDRGNDVTAWKESGVKIFKYGGGQNQNFYYYPCAVVSPDKAAGCQNSITDLTTPAFPAEGPAPNVEYKGPGKITTIRFPYE